VPGQPCVKSGLRLLDGQDSTQASFFRRLNGQLASDLIKRSRKSEHEILVGQTIGGMLFIEGQADMR
jgi:hypothetical protein